MRKIEVLSFVLLVGFVSTACQRSPAYRRDQSWYNENADSYYSAGQAKGATEKIEALGQPKKRVVVLDFWNDTPVKQADLGSFAADELRRGLFLTRKVILPEDVKSALGTDHFLKGDELKVEQLIREGRRLGVSVLVVGRIAKVAFRQRGGDIGVFSQKQSLAGVDVELKVFDVAQGREIMAIGRPGQSEGNTVSALDKGDLESPEYRGELTKIAVRDAVSRLIPDVVRTVEKMSWQGSVAKIIGNKVYLNAGRSSGLVVGDILRVLTKGDDIYDPASGAFLGRSRGQLKGTLEVVDFLGGDAAIGEIHTGANFQVGDAVQLY